MTSYTQKQRTVEAHQYDENEPWPDFLQTALVDIKSGNVIKLIQPSEFIPFYASREPAVNTPQGLKRVQHGDFVVLDPDGFYLVKTAEQFDAHYYDNEAGPFLQNIEQKTVLESEPTLPLVPAVPTIPSPADFAQVASTTPPTTVPTPTAAPAAPKSKAKSAATSAKKEEPKAVEAAPVVTETVEKPAEKPVEKPAEQPAATTTPPPTDDELF